MQILFPSLYLDINSANFNLCMLLLWLQVSSLNDLLACDKAVPADPMSWEVSEELSDLYAIYSKSDPKPAPEKVSRLQYLLGIDDSTATALREMEDGALSSAAEEGNFVF